MLFSHSEGFVNFHGFKSLVFGGNTYYYSGIFFLRGRRAGDDSVIAFAMEYDKTGVLPLSNMFGSFCFAISRSDGRTMFFSDNSNLHCFYLGTNAISDNFLELARYERAGSFNDEALCELLVLGGIYFGKTLLKGIAVTASDCIYEFANGMVCRLDKKLGDIDAPTNIEDVPSFFRDLSYAIADSNITLSLTGGYDSRLVFACINEHLAPNVFISCSTENDADVVCAKKTAIAGGRVLEIVKSEQPEITDEYIEELFDYAQGNTPFLDDIYLRVSSFALNRAEKGFTTFLTGDGGPRHKDWYWIQDFPFFRKRHTNIHRFYDQRIEVIKQAFNCGSRLRGQCKDLRQRFINNMQHYVKPLNTQSYDSFGFHIFGDMGKITYSVQSKLIASYAPLWELELVRYSYHLPRWKRFFNNSMREIITSQSRSIARVPTMYGTTASSEPLFLIRDIFFQSVDYFKRAARLVGRNLFQLNLFNGGIATWSAERDVRRLNLSQRALDYSVKEGIVDKGASLSTIPYGLLGRIIQVYLLSKKMEDWK